MRVNRAPMEKGRSRIDLSAGESLDLAFDEVNIPADLFRCSHQEWMIRKFVARMKGQFQPARVILPFGLVLVGKLRQIEVLFRSRIEQVQNDLGSVFLVEIAEHSQIGRVENALVVLLMDIPRKETVVVNLEPVTRMGVFEPDDPGARRFLLPALRIRQIGDELGLYVFQKGVGEKLHPFAPNRNLLLRVFGVDEFNLSGRIGNGSHDLDSQFLSPGARDHPEDRASVAFVDDCAIERLVEVESTIGLFPCLLRRKTRAVGANP